MTSIRRQLIVVLAVSLAGVLLIGGVILYVSFRATLMSQFDAALDSKLRSLASLVTWTPQGIDFDFSDEYMPEFRPGPKAEYFEIRLADGTLVGRSRSLDGVQAMATQWNAKASSIWNASLPDGRPGRMAALRFQPQLDHEDGPEADAGALISSSPATTVMLARDLDDVNRPLHALIAGLLCAAVAMTLGLAAVVWRAVDWGLKPLNRLASDVEEIDVATLSSRVDCDGPDEIRPICTKLNALLQRLEEAFDRERRFSSAAAHELRTPVAELRTLAEVSLRWPDDPSMHAHTMKQALDIALQMEAMIQTLLSLARSRETDVPIRVESVPLTSIVQPIVETLRARIARKSIEFKIELPDHLAVRTDRAILASVLTNLLDNAVEYVPRAGKVSIRATPRNGRLDVAISNTNDGLTRGDLQRVCEPFWRSDSSHSDHTHCGLGMTLVRELTSLADLRFRMGFDDSNNVEAVCSIPQD